MNVVHTPSVSALKMIRQKDFPECKAGLGYIVNSSPAWAREIPCLKNQINCLHPQYKPSASLICLVVDNSVVLLSPYLFYLCGLHLCFFTRPLFSLPLPPFWNRCNMVLKLICSLGSCHLFLTNKVATVPWKLNETRRQHFLLVSSLLQKNYSMCACVFVCELLFRE